MAKDLLLDENNDLLFINGELVIGESEMQDVALIIGSNPGDWKEHPLVGMGMPKYVNQKTATDVIEAQLRRQLAFDGKDYNKIKNKIKLNGKLTQ